ncbi:MAG TPA: pyrimidine reductase family protein [Mycobacteriales bacterium]|jgi:riboflavin biosynthesis pyrimidine reductase|nr:pyrimidine reductase family protein [Mycobacteriales bacterium]
MSAITQLLPRGDGSELAPAQLEELYPVPERPWLRMNFTSSVDGAVTVDGVSAPLSGDADKTVFKHLRDSCDAVLIGAQTVRREGCRPPLPNSVRQAMRRSRGLAPAPRLVIVSGSLHLEPEAVGAADPRVLEVARPIVFTTESSDPTRRARLTPYAEVVCLGADTVDLVAAVAWLHRHGLRQLLCEGGPHLFGRLAALGLVDELCLTVSPLLALNDAMRVIAGQPGTPEHPPLQLRLAHVLHSAGVLLTRYLVAE